LAGSTPGEPLCGAIGWIEVDQHIRNALHGIEVPNMSPKDETRLSGAEISLREERPVMRHALRQRQRGLPATSRRGHATLLPGYGGRRFPASLTASAVLLPSSGGRRLPCRAGETETREG